jgi:lipopolysaccharide biosynthesis glycosyltransferase
MINIFIGYDHREAIAYHVCSNSIIRQSTKPVSITPLALKNLQDYEEKHTDGSNQFIYSRFLVPHLMNYKGWAIFMDGDMLVRDDINKLWELRDESKAVMVVKHDYKTKMTEKYLGSKNENYPRKNWSSVILWNCNHPANKVVTPEFVQNATGAQVHRFSWLSDEIIGELPKEWNWLDMEYDHNPTAKLVHYTLGTPCFHEFADQGDFANEWHRERLYADYCLQRNI